MAAARPGPSPNLSGVSRARVAVVIPARDAAEKIAATVAAALRLPGVAIVVVCDDGSGDATGKVAAAAGAVVVSHRRPRGRAAALESSVNALGVLEQRDRRPECGTVAVVDAGLGAAAAELAPVLRRVTDSEAAEPADLAIAVAGPADGVVAGSAARGVAELTGWTPTDPLATNRCLTRRAYELASPLAGGGGADVGMTVDLLKAGLRVVEVPVDLPAAHPATDLGGQLGRARQIADVTRALAARGLVRAGWQDVQDSGGVRGLLDRFRR